MRATKLTAVINCKKTNVHPQPQHHEDMKDYDTDSPPYSPTPSEMERPSFHPQMIFDLRHACAILVNETNPPDPDDEPDHKETLRKIEQKRKAEYVAQQARAAERSQKVDNRDLKTSKPRKEETKKEQPKKTLSTKPIQDVREPAAKSAIHQSTQAAYQDMSKAVPQNISANSSKKRASEPHDAAVLVGEPLEPTHTKVLSAKAQGKQKEVDRPEDSKIQEIRQTIHARPKTSAAATVDYVGEHTDSSRSTSRSASNFAPHRPTSTALTSLAITPSHVRRPSDESYQEELSRKETDSWMREQMAQRQAEQQSTAKGPARPASRSSRLSRMTGRSDVGDRPPSRAGSIAGSIADSVSNFIRPRVNSSAESVRSGRSSVTSDRSRESSVTRSSSRQGFFRRNSLRRKGSWASFRSARLDQEEKNTNKNGEPNLNRPLPALPGLDSYKETKTHIGQLMKVGSKKPVKKKHIGDPQPLVAPQTLYTATVPKPANITIDRQNMQFYQRNDDLSRQFGTHPQPLPVEQPRRSTLPKNISSHNQTQPQQLPGKRSSSIPNFAFPRKSSDSRPDQPHTIRKTPSNISNPKSPTHGAGNRLHQGPPLVRGPSYHEEVEAGMYPRPMDIGKGPHFTNGDYYNVKLVDVGPEARHDSGASNKGLGLGSNVVSPMQSPPVGTGHEEHGHWERKGGFKGRMGRMFGSGSRAVAAN